MNTTMNINNNADNNPSSHIIDIGPDPNTHAINIVPEYLVSLVILGHGSTIDMSLNPAKREIMKNVVLYSVAEENADLCIHISSINQIVRPITNEFNQGFKVSDNISKIAKYRETYNAGKDPASEKMYRIIENVEYDKVFSFERPTYWNVFSRSHSGVFLTAVHSRVGDDYIYNARLSNKYNLLVDLMNLAKIMETPDEKYKKIMAENSGPKKVSKNMSLDEKIAGLETLNYRTDDTGYINEIKMSALVKYVKMIFGNNVAINIFDFTCNGPPEFAGGRRRGGRKTRKYRGGRRRRTRNKNRGVL